MLGPFFWVKDFEYVGRVLDLSLKVEMCGPSLVLLSVLPTTIRGACQGEEVKWIPFD